LNRPKWNDYITVRDGETESDQKKSHMKDLDPNQPIQYPNLDIIFLTNIKILNLIKPKEGFNPYNLISDPIRNSLQGENEHRQIKKNKKR
jgi:hypothetical protein